MCVSGTRVLASDLLNPFGCKLGPPWTRVVLACLVNLGFGELGGLGNPIQLIICGVAGPFVLLG